LLRLENARSPGVSPERGEQMPSLLAEGRLALAAAMIGLGILGFEYGDFALVWQAVPKWVPGRGLIASACAAVMLGGGAALLWRRTAARAAEILTSYLALWLLLLRVPQLFIAPLTEVSWSGCGENAVMLAGSWILFARLTPPRERGFVSIATGEMGVRNARIFYGFALLPCGLAHFAYVQATADLVPRWLPWHAAWAYATGAAYLAAGASIVSGIYARCAALLSAIMMGTFTILVWVPAVWAAPRDRFQWTALLISSALTAGAWIVAGSYRQTLSPHR
jgi:uncharacterized membrane protein